ncbi:WD40 repeat domain-containing protein [Marivirga sp. S37H4]|uniref:WD40 repeat domain-containing protein n=1 Tax=Marivirga aurantiaca TaxID=2802615 RepID=A0A934WXL2_9BACT|nr:WD40 repeat domain-containing protein [Marivirga aurantiaca]MBK6264720.1 WD40 repeat domain-containing protein [Marivirga aurantiaca]
MPKINVEKIQTLTGHKDCLYTLEAGADPQHFFSAGGDGIIAHWDLENPELGSMVARVKNSVYALHYLPHKHQLVVGHNYEGIHLIDVDAKKELKSAKITSSAIFDINSIDNMIISACSDGQIILSDVNDLSTIRKIKLGEKSARTIAIHPNKEEIAVGMSDNSIKILSTIDWQIKHNLQAHKNSVFTLQYSADGKLLLSAGRDAHLKIWNSTSEYSLQESIAAHMYAINHISYSADGLHFATCSMDKSIKIWDAKAFKLIKVIDKARHAGHGTSVNKLLWTNYKNQLISASDDRSLSIWNIQID